MYQCACIVSLSGKDVLVTTCTLWHSFPPLQGTIMNAFAIGRCGQTQESSLFCSLSALKWWSNLSQTKQSL